MATGITLNKLAYSLFELIRGSIKDADDVDIRELYFWINTQRALWVSKSLEEKSLYPFEQDFGLFELELVDSVVDDELPEVGSQHFHAAYDTEHSVLRTIRTIPKPLYRNGIPLITRVGSVDRHIMDFKFTTYRASKTVGNGRFSSKDTFAYLMNDRVYIKSKQIKIGALKYINIRGILEDPTALAGATDVDGRLCYDPDADYPVSADLVDYMLSEIIKFKLPLMANTPNDTKNDGAFTQAPPQDNKPL